MPISGHSGKMRLGIRVVVLMVMSLAGHVPKPAFAADPTNFVFVASRDRAEVAVIDSLTDEVARRLPLPAVPGDMTPLARGRLLAAVHPSLRQVTVVDVINGNIARTVQVPVRPDAARADPTGTALAVLDHGSGKIAVVMVATGQVRLIPNITDAVCVVFDAKGRLIGVRPSGAAILDTAGRQIAELGADRADGPVTNAATDPGGEMVYIVQPAHGVLSVFNLHTTTRTAVLRLPAPLGQVVPSPDSQFVLVPSGTRSIAVISNWRLRERPQIATDASASIVGLALFQSVVVTLSSPGREAVLFDLWKQ